MRIVGLICVWLLGCDGGEGLTDGGALAEGGALTDAGGLLDAAVITDGEVPAAVELEVVIENGGVILPIEDGATVPFVWGLQGGTMIQPGVLLPAHAVEGIDLVRLTVRHRPDPAHPAAFRNAAQFADVIQDLSLWPYGADRVLAGPVDQQLGRSDLDGMRLQLEITVSAPTFEVHKTLQVAISNPATPCDGFRRSGGACQYWSLPLPMQVIAHDPAPGCPNAVVPMVEYLTDGADTRRCAEWLGLDGEPGVLPAPGLANGADADCLDEMGLNVGAAVPGRVAVQDKGDCAPIVLQPTGDARACVVCE